MVTIWAGKTPYRKVLTQLSPVLAHNQDIPLKIVNDFSVPTSTKVVLALGSEPLKALQEEKLVPKNRTITSLRTAPIAQNGHQILVSYDAGIGEIDNRYYIDLLTDVALAMRFCRTGSFQPKMGKYQWVDDLSEVCAYIQQRADQTKEPVDVMLDLETLGLDPYRLPTASHPGAYIVSIQVCAQIGTGYAVRFHSRQEESDRLAPDTKLWQQLCWLLTNPQIKMRGANFKYDLHWLYVRAGVECSNFTFDTNLVGTLLDENRSNGLDLHVKMYAPRLAGYCVTPETRLLTADLRWVQAKTVQVGDELLGFDEKSSAFKFRRRMRNAKVLNVQSLVKRCYRLKLASGREITVSDNHQFLKVRPHWGGKVEWVQTEYIKPGMILKTFPMADFDTSYESGWMAGVLDGEGWGSRSKTISGVSYKVGWAQKKGLVLSKSLALVESWGLKFSPGSSEVKTPSVTMYGWDGLELLQRTRPIRLLSKRGWEDTPLPTRNDEEGDAVVEKELVGAKEVLAIATTTHTFIAEGICSHNSDEFDRVVDKSRMDLALINAPAKFLDYACGDVDGGLEASQVMKKVLCEDKHLTALYCNILHPASRAFEKIERGGVFVDREALRELKADLEAEQVALVKRARQILGGRIVAKHHDPTKIGGINLTKASLIRDYMFSRTMGLGLRHRMATDSTEELPHDQQDPATSAEHLKMFVDDPKARDFISVHQEYSQVTKTYNTYVVGFLEHLRSDGKFHPTYYLFMGNRDEDEGGTVTGRLSCKDPAFQTIPKRTKWAKRIRRCYPAPPGYVVVERDYSQGELRVIACIAHCKKMLEVYQQGKDLHTKTAASAAKMSYDVLEAMKRTDEDQYEAIRQKGKAGNFGLCFRMGAEGFREYARKNYDVIFTLPEAEEFRNAFFAEYPELLRYHDNCVEQVHKYQHVRTPLGRIRHLPLIKSPDRKKRSEAERHAINSPVQGCLTDMLMWDFALEDAAGMFEVAPAFGAVHDAAYNYCPEDRVDIEIPRMLEIQENLPFERLGWKPQLPFLADAKYGPNMADLKKFSRKG